MNLPVINPKKPEDPKRVALIEFNKTLEEIRFRREKKAHCEPGGLYKFVKYFWSVLEPETPFKDSWALYAICLHLEAVTRGEINRLLINVPPGFAKSLITDVFWPAWEWGPMGRPHLRYVAFSYAASLTERDNGKFKDLLMSSLYQEMWGKGFALRKIGAVEVSNSRTGRKFASSVGGTGTGERGDRVILDDPHNIKEVESKVIRDETVRWFRESLQSRLNDPALGVIVVIMQRTHEDDVSGAILSEEMDYCHLMIPMEFEVERRCITEIGWQDPREEEGELAWPEHFPPEEVAKLEKAVGPYAYAGQYQQRPEARGGGILKREYWQPWSNPDDENDPEFKTFPPFEFLLAQLDTAFTEDEENDPSALTIWGVWRDQIGNPKVMLVWAWTDRKELHGIDVERLPGESDAALLERQRQNWGLCEIVADYCNRFKVNLLRIEAKAAGLSAAQELRKLYANEYWGVEVFSPKGDKVSYAYAVQHLLADGSVYAPFHHRAYAQKVIDQCAIFPKGAHDDLVDTTTQGLLWLRDRGFLTRRDETELMRQDEMRPPKRRKPLYPTMRG